MAGLTYAQFFPSDWRTGTVFLLNLEEEGLYIRACAFMWDTGEPIPGNDVFAAKLLNVNHNKYTKVMAALIEKGKMTRGQGVVFNERVMAEISEYQLARSEKSERAKRGHESKRKTADEMVQLHEEIARLKEQISSGTPRVHPPGPPPQSTPGVSYGVHPQVPPQVISEKPNDFNESVEQVQGTSSRNPESRIQNPEEVKKREEKKGTAIALLSSGDDPVLSSPKSNEIDALEAFNAYNDLAQRIGLPTARALTPDRRKKIMARMRDHGGRDAWTTALANIERSAFLRGRNDRNWVASLDFMLQPASFTKLVDGVYGNGAHAEPKESGYERTLRLAMAAQEHLGLTNGGRS